jgi:hypothetical protein
MSYKVLTDGNGSGLINVVGLGHFIRLSDHNEVIKECQFAKQELIDLKAERDALAAQLVAIQDAALKPRDRTRQQWIDNITRNALGITARQHLSEIRAEAVADAIKRCNIYMAFPVRHGKLADEVIAVSEIKQYAEEIRQGVVK